MTRIIAVLLFAILAISAQARWNPQYAAHSPEIQQWFKQQHNSRGEWCCDSSDGHPFYGDYTLHPDGHVTVDLDGKPHDIDAALVLKGKNPTGTAVWWFRNISGVHRDYCFSPGTLS